MGTTYTAVGGSMKCMKTWQFIYKGPGPGQAYTNQAYLDLFGSYLHNHKEFQHVNYIYKYRNHNIYIKLLTTQFEHILMYYDV